MSALKWLCILYICSLYLKHLPQLFYIFVVSWSNYILIYLKSFHIPLITYGDNTNSLNLGNSYNSPRRSKKEYLWSYYKATNYSSLKLIVDFNVRWISSIPLKFIIICSTLWLPTDLLKFLVIKSRINVTGRDVI